MNLQGKKVNFLGDSITQGVGASAAEFNFVNQTKLLLGLAEARNYGISGTRIAPRKLPSANPIFDQPFTSRVEGMDANADAIVVFGGTNDFGHGMAPLGTVADEGEETFCGALKVLFVKLIEKYPGKPIVVLTPLHRLGENNIDGDANGHKYPLGHPLRDFVLAIKDVAEIYSLPVLDLWSVSGMQPSIPAIQQGFMPDGLHPNDAGHRLIAERLSEFLKAL